MRPVVEATAEFQFHKGTIKTAENAETIARRAISIP